MTGTTTSRPLRKDAARNRGALIAAAREVFAERGLEASLDDVARRAGVGVGTAYRHFANKHELAQAIFTEAVEDIIDLAHLALTLDDPWDGLVGFLEGTATAQSGNRGLREVMMGDHDEGQLDRLNDRLSVPLNELVDRAKAAGSMRTDADVTDVGIIVTMLCSVADMTGDASPELWRRYLPMLLDGLRPGAVLPVAPLDEQTLRAAMRTHKRRLLRVGQHSAS